MNVVDSSAWLSYFANDANAEVFSTPIENINEVIVPSIIITEVFKCILRQRDEDSALNTIAGGFNRHLLSNLRKLLCCSD